MRSSDGSFHQDRTPGVETWNNLSSKSLAQSQCGKNGKINLSILSLAPDFLLAYVLILGRALTVSVNVFAHLRCV